MRAIGVDIGGTKILAATVLESGRIQQAIRIPTPNSAPQILEAVTGLVGRLRQKSAVLGVGVAAAGFLDRKREVIYKSPNVPDWVHEPLRSKLELRLGLPVIMENDANAAAWAEYRFGASRDSQNSFMLTVGTGVGGAAIVNGELLLGGFGIAGEAGHIPLAVGGRLCGCAQRGCAEQYSSGGSFLRKLKELKSDFSALSDPTPFAVSLLNKKDPLAFSLLDEVAENLGVVAVSVSGLLDPDTFIIGGGVSRDQGFIEAVRRSFLQHLPAVSYRPRASFHLASFRNESGVIGAAELLRKRLG